MPSRKYVRGGRELTDSGQQRIGYRCDSVGGPHQCQLTIGKPSHLTNNTLRVTTNPLLS